IEYFHIASLLFDDLPCMDDAWTRRGLPCAHRLHGEAATVLAALALINRAYGLIGFALADQPITVRLQATACLDSALGQAGLVGGQARDLNFAATDRTARAVARIAAAKTGSLFWLAVYFPAVLALPDEVERRSLKALCIYWGQAFQATDDLQDVLATPMESGKIAGNDARLDRPNLALILGVPATRDRIARLATLSTRTLRGLVARGGERWAYLAAFHAEFSAPLNALAAAEQAA
ncbi:MAG: polyprenyl synthetase family protein, partial [Verrucomicrobiota bacterium]